MPESKVRPEAAAKKKLRREEELQKTRYEKSLKGAPGERPWAVPLFVTVFLLGVAWIVVASVAGSHIGFIAALGNWNILIGMILIAGGFCLTMLWK
ncbi:MAG: cell division protein CrgA [Propionibacteriaceae bacterium]|jgi:hypothetical protein|nr:cell division protein CrgA [Propionibacteriaceae bacterium]